MYLFWLRWQRFWRGLFKTYPVTSQKVIHQQRPYLPQWVAVNMYRLSPKNIRFVWNALEKGITNEDEHWFTEWRLRWDLVFIEKPAFYEPLLRSMFAKVMLGCYVHGEPYDSAFKSSWYLINTFDQQYPYSSVLRGLLLAGDLNVTQYNFYLPNAAEMDENYRDGKFHLSPLENDAVDQKYIDWAARSTRHIQRHPMDYELPTQWLNELINECSKDKLGV